MKNTVINTEKEYVCVRVQIVKVKKGLFGHSDKVLGFTVVIPDTPEIAEKIFRETQNRFKKYGVEIKIE